MFRSTFSAGEPMVNRCLRRPSVNIFMIGSPQPDSQLNSNFGPRDEVGNVSGNRCVSDCIPRGSEFDPSPVPFDHEKISTVILLPSADHSRRVVVSYKR